MRFPILESILASATPTFRDAPKVEVNCWATSHGDTTAFNYDSATAKLILPRITVQEYETLPKEFDVSTIYHAEDDLGRAADIPFHFHVKIEDAVTDQTKGEVELKYTAELLDNPIV